jgi:hypothetical protein
MGYVEETGVAQHFRDVRIASIYEGTNGIQAGDLIGRKVLRDGAPRLPRSCRRCARRTRRSRIGRCVHGRALRAVTRSRRSRTGIDLCAQRRQARLQPRGRSAMNYLMLLARSSAAGRWRAGARRQRCTRTGAADDKAFLQTQIVLAQFHAEQSCRAPGLTALRCARAAPR